LSGAAVAVVDEVVVHDAAQPRSRRLNFNQIIETWKYFGENVLEQVFRFRLVTGESERHAIEAVEMRL